MTVHDASSSDRVLAGRYRLGARRGAGVDIAVFDAMDMGLGRAVVVKVVHPDLCAVAGFEQQFRSVLQRVASIDHPNVGRVLDWGGGDWGGRTVQFVVTDVLDGGSLRDLIDRGRQLTLSQTVMLGLDVCRGLDVAHRLGVVHGDIRPSNLVFGQDGTLKIIDLGLSRLVSAPMWADGSQVSLDRARYAAPEQASGQPAEAKSDVYALCLTLIELMTAQVPFLGDSAVATLQNRVARLMPVSADFGPLAAVLERAGRPERDDRYSAGELGRALVQAAERLPRPTPIALASVGLFSDAAPPAAGPVLAPPPTLAAAPTLGLAQLVARSAASSGNDTAMQVGPPPDAFAAVAGDAGFAPPPAPAGAGDPSGAMLRPTAAEPPLPDRSLPGGIARGPVPPPPPPDHSAPILRERRSRRKLILVLVVVLFAASIGGAGAWWLGREQSFTVPDLVGVEQAEALNSISEFAWKSVVTEQFDDTVQAGVVISTDPPAGARLTEGGAFSIVASKGAAPRTLPEINGMTVDAATAALQALGLIVQLGDQVSNEVVAPGTIVSWSVAGQPGLVAGATVVRGTTVLVVVSAGPAPRIVTDFTGATLADATTQIVAAGLVVVQLQDEFSPTVPVGAIARQEPAAGSAVPRGGTVSLALSKGPDLVVVPPLASLTVQQATDALTAAGLTMGTVKGDPTGLAVLAEVDGASIGAAASLPRGTAIDVTFEVPPPPTTLPPETTTTSSTTLPA